MVIKYSKIYNFSNNITCLKSIVYLSHAEIK